MLVLVLPFLVLLDLSEMRLFMPTLEHITLFVAGLDRLEKAIVLFRRFGGILDGTEVDDVVDVGGDVGGGAVVCF